jgi:hypothetical protein
MNENEFTSRASRPAALVEVFESVWLLDAHLSGEGWKYLWDRYGKKGVIDIARRSGWFATESNAEATERLIQWSRAAGYDPQTRTFLSGQPAENELASANAN